MIIGLCSRVITKHLVYHPDSGYVYDRESYRISHFICGLGVLGTLQGGPRLPIDDLDIIQEWRDLQEYAALHAGR